MVAEYLCCGVLFFFQIISPESVRCFCDRHIGYLCLLRRAHGTTVVSVFSENLKD